MGKNDIAVNQWFANKERFADLFNAVLFGGKQEIQPESLVRLNNEASIILQHKDEKESPVKRYRDLVMRWNDGMDFVILAGENQDKVHYRMPVRTMIYDGISYMNQLDAMWKEHEKYKDEVTNEEFLSRMKKDDRLIPVVTLVFYYGEQPWDGSLDLYGMLGINEEKENLRSLEKFIPNYHINLIDAARIKDIEVFRTDLQVVLGMLQYKNQKDALLDYVQKHKDYFCRLDIETYRAVQAFLGAGKKLERVISAEGAEEIDMCKALDDLYEEGVERGIEQGIKRGIEQGIEQGIEALIQDNLEENVDESRIIQKLEKRFSLTREQAQRYYERFGKTKHILFDLDGTLLPMNQDEFVNFYFPLLAKRFKKYDLAPEKVINAVWKGLGMMVLNDGEYTNEEVFWQCFEKIIGIGREELEPELLDFYNGEFNQAVQATKPNPAAGRIVSLLKAKGYKVYLATNPIFPECATLNRIQWAGLLAEDFEEITTYENCHYCKPNPMYFKELMDKYQLQPQDCLMVGNDVEEDLAIRELGVKTYLATDCLENKKELPIISEDMGTLEKLEEKIRAGEI